MFATYKIRNTVLAFILLGCGANVSEELENKECEVYNDMYSHTVLFCGGRHVDNIQDVFQVCNHRGAADDQVENCVSNFDLMEFDDGCDVQHICWRE